MPKGDFKINFNKITINNEKEVRAKQKGSEEEIQLEDKHILITGVSEKAKQSNDYQLVFKL